MAGVSVDAVLSELDEGELHTLAMEQLEEALSYLAEEGQTPWHAHQAFGEAGVALKALERLEELRLAKEQHTQ
jgi:hypothetical protein